MGKKISNDRIDISGLMGGAVCKMEGIEVEQTIDRRVD